MHTKLAVLVGAAFGAVLGFFAFSWVLGQGYYGLIIPGGLVGLGAGISKNRSIPLAVVCGVVALGAGLFTEWWHFSFLADSSFPYFLGHVYELKPVTLMMLGVGAVIGFYIPYARAEEFDKRRPVD